MQNQIVQAMRMYLLAHKGSLELTLSTQPKEYGLNPQISQREVGESRKALGLQWMAYKLSNITKNNNPSLKWVWGY
jgi:hypothetical protein